MWFLDLNSSIFLIIVTVFYTMIIIVVAFSKLKENKAQILTMVLSLFLMFATPMIVSVYADKEKYPKLTAGKHFTLGELWCNYDEYKGELCRNYVEYALDNQKKDRQVQFEQAQAKQQKLDKEIAHKHTIRANYENLVKELVDERDEKD